MTLPEARRHDLYNGLEEVLGTDRADTLMAYLPTTEAAALATRHDMNDVKAEIQDVRTEIQEVRTELRAELEDVRSELKSEIQDVRTEIRSVNQRLDRLFLTLAAGLIATMGAVVTALFIA